MKEDHSGSIEKQMAEFFRGMDKLRESQNKTDEQLKGTDLILKETAELIKELRESQKKTDAQLLKTDAQLLKTDAQLLKTDEQLNKTIKKLDRIGEQLGDLGITQGKVAEDLFYRNVKTLFKQKNMMFAQVRRNVKKKGIAEYDIVAVDKDKVLVIEVKNKMERRMIDEFIGKKIPNFKSVFPQYNDYHVIGGVGSLVMQDDVGQYAEKKGLYVLTQSGDGGAMLLNHQDFKAKEFF